MNDRRFLELLNLYVDQQIDSSEAAELEAAVLNNPQRRRTYDQYCRLQRACGLLGERERSVAPASRAFTRSMQDAERKIAAPRRPVFWRGAYAGTFAASAMAACVALVLMNREASDLDPSISQPVAAQQRPAVPVEPVLVASSVAVEPAFEAQPVFTDASLGVTRNAREAEIAANDRTALEWMQKVEASSHRMLVDDQTFETRPSLQQDNRVFRGRQSVQGNAEFTAFQFQR